MGLESLQKVASLRKVALRDGMPEPSTPTPQIMNPAAQGYYQRAATAGTPINLLQAKSLEYASVPGGFQRVRDIAQRAGGNPASLEALDRNIPVRQDPSSPYLGVYSPAKGTLRVNPRLNNSKMELIDTMAHETTHAVDDAGGNLAARQADTRTIPVPAQDQHKVPAGQPDPYRSQAAEQMAGPFHYMKAFMANRTNNVPENEAQAAQAIQQFRTINNPSWFKVPYANQQWDSIFRSPDAPKRYLQTLQAPTPSVFPGAMPMKTAAVLPRLVKVAADLAAPPIPRDFTGQAHFNKLTVPTPDAVGDLARVNQLRSYAGARQEQAAQNTFGKVNDKIQVGQYAGRSQLVNKGVGHLVASQQLPSVQAPAVAATPPPFPLQRFLMAPRD